jgi:hypothetical protein
VSQASAIAQAYGVDETTLLEALYSGEARANPESKTATLELHHTGAMLIWTLRILIVGIVGHLGLAS